MSQYTPGGKALSSISYYEGGGKWPIFLFYPLAGFIDVVFHASLVLEGAIDIKRSVAIGTGLERVIFKRGLSLMSFTYTLGFTY